VTGAGAAFGRAGTSESEDDESEDEESEELEELEELELDDAAFHQHHTSHPSRYDSQLSLLAFTTCFTATFGSSSLLLSSLDEESPPFFWCFLGPLLRFLGFRFAAVDAAGVGVGRVTGSDIVGWMCCRWVK
jgi:hypothetical protein